MTRTKLFIALALITILVSAVTSFSQTTVKLDGPADLIASPIALLSIQFKDDGKTLVGLSFDKQMVAWGLPYSTPAPPPDQWRKDGEPPAPYFWTDLGGIEVKTAEGHKWTLPGGQMSNIPMGWDEKAKRLYYFNKYDYEDDDDDDEDGSAPRGNVTFFSVQEGGKDRKTIGKTQSVNAGDTFFTALNNQIFRLENTANSFIIKDLNDKVIYTGVRHKSKLGYNKQVEKARFYVSPDGKRLRIDNDDELIFVRMSDGAELLHVDLNTTSLIKIATDTNNRYLGVLGYGNMSDPELNSYRVKVYFIPDEPGQAKYSWLSINDGRSLALADQRRRIAKYNSDDAAYKLKKQQEAEAAAAAAQTSSASSSGSNSADAKAYKFLNDAKNALNYAASNMNTAAARRSEGADKGLWCVHVRRAIENLDGAAYAVNLAAQQYSLRYADDINLARKKIASYRQDLSIHGCR